jgi:hypothetical protein
MEEKVNTWAIHLEVLQFHSQSYFLAFEETVALGFSLLQGEGQVSLLEGCSHEGIMTLLGEALWQEGLTFVGLFGVTFGEADAEWLFGRRDGVGEELVG